TSEVKSLSQHGAAGRMPRMRRRVAACAQLLVALTALLAASCVVPTSARASDRANDDDPYNAHDPMRDDEGDDERDIDTTRRGCDGGSGKACRHLAGVYSDGRGVGVDQERAREYLRRGCDSGDEQSCRKLNR